MHYTPRVTFQDPNQQSIRGSLPDLRGECTCAARRSMLRIQGQYSGSTESLLDEADDFLRNSLNGEDDTHRKSIGSINNGGGNRRFSENDIKRGIISKCNIFLLTRKTETFFHPEYRL